MSVKTKKILIFALTVLLVMGFLGTTVFASSSPIDAINTMEQNTQNGAQNSTELAKLGGSVLGILQVAGVIIGTIILVVLGLKYMMGSLEEKAEYKKTMIPFVVGAVIVMAAPTIARGIFNLISSL